MMLLNYVVWQKSVDVSSQEPTVSILKRWQWQFFQNVGEFLPDKTSSYLRI